jgi:acyl-CoA thioesterase I
MKKTDIMKKIIISILPIFLLWASCKNTTETKSADTKTTQSVDNQSVAKKSIMFFGNSLTAAYGLEDVSKGFVGLIENRLDSLKMPYTCINAGISGETTSGGDGRVDFTISQQPIDIFILELGGNDALRGINPESSIKNLQSIIDKVKAKYPTVKIILAGMEAPRNMGEKYITAFHNMYPTLAKKNNLPLIPFILEGVGGIAELNQKDGIHPTEAGNKIIVENIWTVLKPVL